MAKKKVDESTIDENDYLSRIEKSIQKKYGEGLCVSIDEIRDRQPKIISVSPALDCGLNGGISEGSLTICAAQPKVGKTTTALTFARNCQKEGKVIHFIDVEHRLKKINYGGIDGLDTSKKAFNLIRSTEERILSAEETLSICEEIVNTHPGAVIIFDSFSALCSEKERADDLSGQSRSVTQKLLAMFLRRISNVLAVNRIILFGICHLGANVSGYGPKWLTDMGMKLQYFLDNKIEGKGTKDWKIGSGENEKIVGQIITWQIECSGLGGIPGTKLNSYLRYGVGLDSIYEMIDLGIMLGLIEKAGAWMKYQEVSYQGMNGIYEFFKENNEEYNNITKKIRGILYG